MQHLVSVADVVDVMHRIVDQVLRKAVHGESGAVASIAGAASVFVAFAYVIRERALSSPDETRIRGLEKPRGVPYALAIAAGTFALWMWGTS